MSEELKYRVRVLGVDELVGLNKEIQKNDLKFKQFMVNANK